MYNEEFSVSRELGFEDFEDDFSDSRDSVFVNSFSVTSSLCAQKMPASAVELGFEDDLSDNRDSVFVNSFSVTSSLCAQKMSASAVDLGFRYDFWYSWVSRMIFRTAATLFSSTVSQSAVVYVRKKHHCQP